MNDPAFLFIGCANLNTEHCPYTKKPEEILSLFSDPENFPINDQKRQELNTKCSDCEWFQRK